MAMPIRSLADARTDAPGDLVKTSAGVIHAVVRGQGPDVVLIHGVTDNHRTWSKVQREMAGEARVHAVDLLGHGLSDIPARPLSVLEMGQGVLAYLDAAGISEAVLVGNSLGCGVSLAVAHLAPARVRALLLLNGIGVEFTIPLALRLLRIGGAGEMMHRFGNRPKLRRFILRDTFHRGFVQDEEGVEGYWAGWRIAGRPAYIRALLRAIEPGEPTPWLASIKAPTHVVHGDEDRIIPVRIGHEVAKRIPGAEKTILKRTGHEPQVERPEDTVRMLRALLAKTALRAAG